MGGGGRKGGGGREPGGPVSDVPGEKVVSMSDFSVTLAFIPLL